MLQALIMFALDFSDWPGDANLKLIVIKDSSLPYFPCLTLAEALSNDFYRWCDSPPRKVYKQENKVNENSLIPLNFISIPIAKLKTFFI